MPTAIPVPDKAAGDVLTETNWDSHIRDNINKLLDRGHRTLTVAQFAALTGLEDGDEVYLEVDAANGVMWHLRYVAAESTNKWRFLGGPPMVSEVDTAENTASASYVALTTAGPSITLPRSGDYDVETGAIGADAGASDGGAMSYDIGGTAAVDADWCPAGDFPRSGAFRSNRKTALTPVALTAKYRTLGGTTQFSARQMRVRPVRIRHDA